MVKSKNYYRQTSCFGYTWVGYWKQLHHYSKRAEGKVCGYYHVAVSEADISDGSYKFMLEHGWTRHIK